jgi:hemimethylated DNA binding protein
LEISIFCIHKFQAWTDNPNYLALIDNRDKVVPQIGYVIEENIEPVEDTSVRHPFLEKYFEKFTGSSYQLR